MRKGFIISLVVHVLVVGVLMAGWNFYPSRTPLAAEVSIWLQVTQHDTVGDVALAAAGIPMVNADQKTDPIKEQAAVRPTLPSGEIGRRPLVVSADSSAQAVNNRSETGGEAKEATAVGAAGQTNGQPAPSEIKFGGNFLENADGTYTALTPTGIDYTLLHLVEPEYPQEARQVDYARAIVVETELLVGLDGQVEQITILNSVPNLGFREEVKQALGQWKFAPIYYQGVNIKMKFYKDFWFEPRG